MERGAVEELTVLIKVWIVAIAASTFCYYVIKQIPRGFYRLISLIPFICLFIYLPLSLTWVHYIVTGFFILTWLGTFKLIMFAFNKGPIGDPSLPLKHFLLLTCLPISIKTSKSPSNGLKSPLNYFTKTILLILIIKSYDYEHVLHEKLMLALLCCHLYFVLEVTLVLGAYPAQAVFGLEVAPQFEEPYMSTSLRDFWGNRWNLMVPAILRPSVYLPIRNFCTPRVGRIPALIAAVFGGFIVSGIMHELMFYYLTGVAPTWEVTRFFLLQGVCTVVEVAVKSVVGNRVQVHPVILRVITVVFVMVTGLWLLLPQIARNGTVRRAMKEYALFVTMT